MKSQYKVHGWSKTGERDVNSQDLGSSNIDTEQGQPPESEPGVTRASSVGWRESPGKAWSSGNPRRERLGGSEHRSFLRQRFVFLNYFLRAIKKDFW